MKKDQARAAESAPEEATLERFAAMMTQRRQLEGWITALDGRRDSTPAHVFERVHADYAARLERVIEDLTSQSHLVHTEIDALSERLVSVTDRMQQAKDERAEAELRAHVGEISSEEWERSAESIDARIAELQSEQADLEPTLRRNRELLEEATRPPGHRQAESGAALEPATEDAGAAAPASSSEAKLQELSAVSDVAEGSAHVPAVEDAPADAFDRAFDEAPSDDAPADLPAAVIAAEAELMDKPEDLKLDPPDDEPAPLSVERPKPTPRSGFDELAFLSSVVDTPAGAIEPGPSDQPDEAARRDSFAMRAQEEGIVNLDEQASPISAPGRTGSSPLAANVSGNVPIVFQEKTGAGAKSLKCSECSAMNYPTEWYCERCGAELASL